jgi:hypothetical protein
MTNQDLLKQQLADVFNDCVHKQLATEIVYEADGQLCLRLSDQGNAGYFLIPETAHKYVHVLLSLGDGSHEEWWFATPITVHEFHRDIVAFLETQLLSHASICFGGGYIDVDLQNDIRVYGRSTQFGAADHEKARQMFSLLHKVS